MGRYASGVTRRRRLNKRRVRPRHGDGYTAVVTTATSTSSSIVRALRNAIGDEQVADDPGTLQVLSRDFLRSSRAVHAATAQVSTPLVVVRPGDTESLARVLKIAARERVPVVEFGG